MRSVLILVLFAIAALSLVSSAQQPSIPTPAAPDAGTANFKWIYASVLKPKCLGCHEEAASYDSLKQAGWIKPGFPNDSNFFNAIVVIPPQTAAYMPQGGTPVGNRGQRAIWWWIKAGANPGP